MRPWVPALALIFAVASPTVAVSQSTMVLFPDPASDVAQAERDFDLYTSQAGFTAGFLAYAAPDGILFRPDPVNVREYLGAREPSTDTALRWGPYRVGVATSADLAWDTGPWTYGANEAHGWFFTVWERQPDGRWQWVLDHGAGAAPDHVPVPAAEDVLVDRQALGVASPLSNPWTEVQAMDAIVNARLVAEGADFGYAHVLAEDVWVNTADGGPARTLAEVWAALEARPRFSAFEPIGGRASSDGDLAYSYSHVRWDEAGTARRGHAIRIWRRDGRGPQGWRLVYDQFSPVPVPAG